MFPNRTYCDTLQEARQLLSKVSRWNYKATCSILESLVEECQVYGNRMEAGLQDKNNVKRMRRQLQKALDKLEGPPRNLEDFLEEMRDD